MKCIKISRLESQKLKELFKTSFLWNINRSLKGGSNFRERHFFVKHKQNISWQNHTLQRIKVLSSLTIFLKRLFCLKINFKINQSSHLWTPTYQDSLVKSESIHQQRHTHLVNIDSKIHFSHHWVCFLHVVEYDIVRFSMSKVLWNRQTCSLLQFWIEPKPSRCQNVVRPTIVVFFHVVNFGFAILECHHKTIGSHQSGHMSAIISIISLCSHRNHFQSSFFQFFH